MPFLHSVPTYKVVKVSAKIGIILYCHWKGLDVSKKQKKMLPVALGAASAMVVGLPTIDIIGLIIVGIKVFTELIGFENIDADETTLQVYQGSWPLESGAKLPLYKAEEAMELTLGNSFIDSAFFLFLKQVEGTGVAGEIAAAILEEFKFTGIQEFLSDLFW